MKPFVKVQEQEFIKVDEWVPESEDIIFKTTKDVIIAPVCQFYGVDIEGFDYFRVSRKRSYNQEKTRLHFVQYLNYFEKFYDQDKELLSIYCNIKYLIDYQQGYTKNAFFYDLEKYIIKSDSIRSKIFFMCTDNFEEMKRKGKRQDDNLQYTNKHSFIMLEMSMIMKLSIPLLTHFAYVNKVMDISNYLLEIYSEILYLFDVDMYSKFYETATSVVDNTVSKNPLWKKQDIRGISPATHALGSIEQIILNLMPKYEFSGSGIYLNFKSIRDNVGHQVLGIDYEYDYIEHSSSKRDAENNSEFDRFESYLVKQDESLYIYNTVNCEETLNQLLLKYGDFSQEEIDFFAKRLLNNENEFVINSFQKYFIFNLFYKYFGDPISLNSINRIQWIKLILLTRKILCANGLIMLAYVLTSKIKRFVTRNSINKKELTELESSALFDRILDKYFSDKIKKEILYYIATIISSEFEIIDFYDSEIDGTTLKPVEEVIKEEILIFISLI